MGWWHYDEERRRWEFDPWHLYVLLAVLAIFLAAWLKGMHDGPTVR